jgi:dephospho-CoA kinase
VDTPHLTPLLLKPLRIGLTGGIGSGKSVVGLMLAELGAQIIDTDQISKQLTATGGDGIESIRTAFGEEFIGSDGALNRLRMREWVFAYPHERRRLEAILHPLIQIEADRQARDSAAPALVFDVPLLAEQVHHWRHRVHKILLIDCSEARQIERVVQRSGWSPQAVLAVITNQATRHQRRACADAVIDNDGITLLQLGDQVRQIWQNWITV